MSDRNEKRPAESRPVSSSRRHALAAAVGVAAGVEALNLTSGTPERVPLVAYLDTLTQEALPATRAAFEDRLRELGWEPGRDVTLDYRFGDSHPPTIAAMAKALIAAQPDVIVTGSNAGVMPLRRVTEAIPIVCANLADAVGSRLARSLARPGRNVSGIASSIGTGILSKRLQLMKEFVPTLRRVAVLRVTGEYSPVMWEELDSAARTLDVELLPVDAKAPESFPLAFEAIAAQRPDGLCLVGQGGLIQQVKPVCDFALQARLPANYALEPFVRNGLLFTYGVNQLANYRSAADYVDRVLRGAEVGELPIEQPMTYEFRINLRTAHALGINVPRSLLQRADEVIT